MAVCFAYDENKLPEDGRRMRGRPRKTWRSTFKEDPEEMGVSWHGARWIAMQ